MRPAVPSEYKASLRPTFGVYESQTTLNLGRITRLKCLLQLGVEYNKKCPMKLFTKCFQMIKDY